jgi:hypothetical protein
VVFGQVKTACSPTPCSYYYLLRHKAEQVKQWAQAVSCGWQDLQVPELYFWYSAPQVAPEVANRFASTFLANSKIEKGVKYSSYSAGLEFPMVVS